MPRFVSLPLLGRFARRAPRPWLFLPGFAVGLAVLGGCGESDPRLPVVDLAAIEAIIAEADANDRVLVIDFWATWCVPCVAMFPDVHEGLKARGDAVRAVSITLDDPGEMERNAVAFLKEHDALKDAYRMKPDGVEQARVVDALGERWQDVVIPAFLVFDRDGELAGEFLEGGDATVEAILARVDELTGERVEAGMGAGSEADGG